MLTVAHPPEGYKRRKNSAWCPYCGKEVPFAWDSRVSAARCPECGVSAQDYHTRVLNGLSRDPDLDRFERNVKTAGKKYKKLFPGENGDGSKEKCPEQKHDEPGMKQASRLTPLEPLDLFCPGCGRHIRSVYPPTRERCSACGSIVLVGKDGDISWKKPKRALYCRGCGRFTLQDPRPGTANWCEQCGIWSALPGDKEGEKVAATAAKEDRKGRRAGSLPEPALAKVRKVAAEDCANYQESVNKTKRYCHRAQGGVCVFFAAGDHRCVWFEQAVLPDHPTLEEVYWWNYGLPRAGKTTASELEAEAGGKEEQVKQAAQEAKKAIKEAEEKREKNCAYCGRPFIPKNNFERYCSEEHKKYARRERDRKRRKGVVKAS